MMVPIRNNAEKVIRRSFLKIERYSQENTCVGVSFQKSCKSEGKICEIYEYFEILRTIFLHRFSGGWFS